MGAPNIRCKSAMLMLLSFTHAVLGGSRIAGWSGLRGAIIRDTLTLEGGALATGNFDQNGQFSGTTAVSNPRGMLYEINLCNSFNTTAIDTFALLNYIEETPDDNSPVWVGGGIVANDFEFYTYGGLPTKDTPEGSSSVINGKLFPYSQGQLFDSAYSPVGPSRLSNVNDRVTAGAYASGPAKDRTGFYFSGMISENGSELDYYAMDSSSKHVTNASSSFVRIDMRDPNNASFSSTALPPAIVPRGESSMVWIPFGDDGTLIVLGGAQYPADLWMIKAPESAPNDFMTKVAVYDIHQDAWYLQETNGGKEGVTPRQLSAFCTVTTAPDDGSSLSIYVYGGYDGGYGNANDEVWVLSIPSFTWTLVSRGKENHRRRWHSCFLPSPQTMISVGGMVEQFGYLQSDTAIDVFDLNTLTWTGVYEASPSKSYVVPDKVVNTGTLSSLFAHKYPRATQTYEPRLCGNNSSPVPPPPPPPPPHKTTIIAACVAAGGAIMMAGLLFWWYRRHRRNKSAQGAARTAMRQNKVASWFRKSSSAGHDPEPEYSNSSGDTGNTMVNDYFSHGIQKAVHADIFEAPSSTVTSPGVYHSPRHGSPYIISPALSGSHEVDATSRHEMMNNDLRGSMSIRDYPGYPRSIQGDFITSARSDMTSVSRPSENLVGARHLGPVSPYELPQDRSNEDLSQPPDMVLTQTSLSTKIPTSGKSFSIEESQVQPLLPLIPTLPIIRKPVAPLQHDSAAEVSSLSHRHQRNVSSISSNLPSLPPPNPDEDKRRSQLLASLPDEGQIVNTGAIVQGSSTRPGRISAYQENFEGNTNRRA
ncbi:hypothetical protein LTR05_004036 [Lithohypha guttulata]|uniref:Galactose oxidase/kelch, beta-propeller n=1 Tax=Lithohypha guttulata TaxID=1690604 RepID=A0AAN7YHA6_9EURO|nr:hypothetical protein LTR05_004036 [Lithohypha guttulata]